MRIYFDDGWQIKERSPEDKRLCTVAAAVVAGAVIGAGASYIGSSKSAGAATEAASTAAGEQAREFNLVRSDTAPYRAAGAGALDKLARLYGLKTAQPEAGPGDGWGYNAQTGQFEPNRAVLPASSSSSPDMSVFQESPDYQFNLAEGQKAIDRSLISRGRGLSGAAVKAGIRYASGAASQQFGDFYNRLAGIAGVGQTAVNTSAGAGANAANQTSNAYLNAGNVRASAYSNGANGVNNAVQGGIGNYLTYQYLNKPPATG